MLQRFALIIFLIPFCLIPLSSYAGWTEDIRLTSRGHEIHPQVIARNDTVHVAWQQLTGDKHMSYMQSLDGGYNWGEIRNIEDAGHRASKFSLSLNNDRLMLGWYDVDRNPRDPIPNIAFSILQEGEWSSPVYVYDTFQGLEFQEVATEIDADTVYVVYLPFDSDSTGYRPFIFLYSTDLGQTWSDEETIAHCGAFTNNLRMAKCYGTVYVFWSGVPIPIVNHTEIIGVVSHDGGQTWTREIQLSSDDYHNSQHTCIACDETSGWVAIGWMEAGYPGDLNLRITGDGGYSWGDIIQATSYHMVADPCLAFAGDTLWAVWSDRDPSYGSGNDEISFSKSTDCGLTWSPYERLTFASGYSYAPWISYDNGNLHVVWWDSRRPPHSGDEIYYKRWEPTVSVDGDSPISAKMRLTVYPNPFNSSVTISVYSLASSEVTIYDLLGRLIQRYSLLGGSHKIMWNGAGINGGPVKSGIYIAVLKGGDIRVTRKLVYLK
jgi:hypothetical protein